MTTTSSDAAGKTAQQRSAFAAAFVDTISVGVGMVPLGAAFGLLVVQSGLDWWWALIFAVLVYAGSMEFLAIALVAVVTPLPQLALTTFSSTSVMSSTPCRFPCAGSAAAPARRTACTR